MNALSLLENDFGRNKRKGASNEQCAISLKALTYTSLELTYKTLAAHRYIHLETESNPQSQARPDWLVVHKGCYDAAARPQIQGRGGNRGTQTIQKEPRGKSLN